MTDAPRRAYWCEQAVVGTTVQSSVTVTVDNGRITSIVAGTAPAADACRLTGVSIAGLANAHSHAFHRALRSRTQSATTPDSRGSFWTWRKLMYRAADRLTPDSYHRLARAVFAEMALTGISCVGEFHYLHHGPGGARYTDANAMSDALVAAASEAGIRMTMLDTVYLHGGLDGDGYVAVEGVQRRFSDGSVDGWIDRVAGMQTTETCKIGAAIHSVRAVDPDSIRAVAAWASAASVPLHAHVSEQTAENEACLKMHGVTPVGLLSAAGALSSDFVAVHATHLADADVALLAACAAAVVMCPTTERDLGDGIGPTDRLADASVPMSLGSDSHAVIDMFEEARAIELDERLRSMSRGVHGAPELLAMATINGHRALGWRDAGSIAVGQRADLVTVATDSVRLAGAPGGAAVDAVVFAATASDITDVIVDGRHIVADGHHVMIDAPRELAAAISELLD